METAVAVDIRGYGALGMRGDIAYIGQLDDDMTDLVGELRKSHAAAKWALIVTPPVGFALSLQGRWACCLVGLYSSRPILAIPHPPIAALKTVGENPIYRESSRSRSYGASGPTGRNPFR
jgi:hypothetical protein